MFLFNEHCLEFEMEQILMQNFETNISRQQLSIHSALEIINQKFLEVMKRIWGMEFDNTENLNSS